MKNIMILICSVLVYGASYSQSYYKTGKYNRLGLQGRYASLTLSSSDIEVEGGEGFFGGLTTRGRLYNNWGMVYGIDFLSVNSEIATSGANGLLDDSTRYNLIGAQVNVLLSYNLIGQNLAIDFGPALLINGRMALEDRGQESNIVSGFTSLTAGELQEVTRINPFAVVGITGGWENVRFMVQYQYGFTNFFGNYNNQDFTDPLANATNFEGTASVISGGVVLYL